MAGSATTDPTVVNPLAIVGQLGLVLTATACAWQGPAPVTPQRPTVSFDTSTTAEGTVELEAGVTLDPGDAVDTPSTVKVGTGPGTELFVGWSPWQQLSRAGDDAEGSGDVVLGARHRVWDGDDQTPSAALVLSGKLPTAGTAGGRGSGEVDLRIGAVLHQSFGPVSANAFYQYGALGSATGAGTVSEHTATLTAGLGLTDTVSTFVELAGIAVPSQGTESLFAISGVAWAASPACILDAGVVAGISDDAPDAQVFLGGTWNFGGPARRRSR